MTLTDDYVLGPNDLPLVVRNLRGYRGKQPIVWLHSKSFSSSHFLLFSVGGYSIGEFFAQGGLDPWAIDAQGYGAALWSSDLDAMRSITANDTATDIERGLELIATITGLKPVVVAYSSGIHSAVTVLQRRPDLVKGLVCLDVTYQPFQAQCGQAYPWDMNDSQGLVVINLQKHVAHLQSRPGSQLLDGYAQALADFSTQFKGYDPTNQTWYAPGAWVSEFMRASRAGSCLYTATGIKCPVHLVSHSHGHDRGSHQLLIRHLVAGGAHVEHTQVPGSHYSMFERQREVVLSTIAASAHRM